MSVGWLQKIGRENSEQTHWTAWISYAKKMHAVIKKDKWDDKWDKCKCQDFSLAQSILRQFDIAFVNAVCSFTA